MAGPLRFSLGILALAALTACATPRQQCIAEATKALRSLRAAIATTEANIARGYAVHRQTISRTVEDVCYKTDPETQESVPYACLDIVFDKIETPVAIDVAQERIKLAEYRRSLPQSEARAQAAVAQCVAQFPE